jgi:hypothetical protein
MYSTNLNAVPLTCLKGITVDISVLLRFYFWQPVYFKLSVPSFPSESKKALGHVVGISEHCGHVLTFKVLSSESDIIIYHSLLRAATPSDGNVHSCMSGGESSIHTGPIMDRYTMDKSKPASTPTDKADADIPPPPIFNPDDLIGRSCLMDEQEDGQKPRGQLLSLLKSMSPEWKTAPLGSSSGSVNNEKAKDIITYNKMLGYIAKDDESDIKWKF